jgi:putative ABC transport system permease protein
MVAFLGGLGGICLALAVGRGIELWFAALPVKTSWSYVVLAEAVSVLVGVVAGVVPARNAARMEPVQALRAE